MTELQFKRFYLPAWNKAAKANDWKMLKGKLVGQRESSLGGPEVNVIYQRVWTFAQQLALKFHRAITPDDLRHACHIEALDQDKSSKDFTNAETDRVVTIFKLMAEPDDVAAMLDYMNPSRAERKRLEWAIEQTPDAYVRAVAAGKFGTRLWENLELSELKQLAMTLRHRNAKWRKPATSPQPLSPSGEGKQEVAVGQDGNPDWNV